MAILNQGRPGEPISKEQRQKSLNELGVLASKPLTNEQQQRLFPSRTNDPPVDHLSYLEGAYGHRITKYFTDKFCYGNTRDAPLIKMLTDVETRESHILRRLGHIPVNPNDRFNTSAIVDSYCFSRDVASDEQPHDSVANWNPSSAKAFVNNLIEIAESQTKLIKSTVDRGGKSLMTNRYVILHGARGSGKTYFENYILSNYSRLLDERKTIWVRINLVQRLSYDSRLVDWIYAQAAKIIIRYFNSNSGYWKKSNNLNIAFDRHFPERVYSTKGVGERRRMEESLKAARLVFEKGGLPNTGIADANLSDRVIHPEVAREVVAAGRLHGFHFIIILDGLDILEATRSYRRRFAQLFGQAIELADSYKRNGFALVLTMRSSTLGNRFKRRHQDTFDTSNADEYIILPPKVDEVIKARLDYIKREVRELENTPGTLWTGPSGADQLARFEAFIQELEEHPGVDLRRRFIDLLKDSQGANVRAIMQMIQFRYFDFVVRQQASKLPYHSIEAMMKAGRRFPPVLFRYELEGKDIVRSIWSRQKYDSRFFPNLFRYPFIEMKSESRSDRAAAQVGFGRPRIEDVVAPLRVVQMLSVWRSMLVTQSDKRGPDQRREIEVAELSEFLQAWLGYNKELIVAVLEELAEVQFIEFENSNLFASAEDAEDNIVVCQPKLEFTLRNVAQSLAYLNMAAMRVPLSSGAFRDASVPFFCVASYEEESDDLLRWVSNKITNAVALVRLILSVDKRQLTSVQQKLVEPTQPGEEFWRRVIETAIVRGVFLFGEEALRTVLRESESAVAKAAMSEAQDAEFRKHCEQYLSAWS
jgi:hypothetical protein